MKENVLQAFLGQLEPFLKLWRSVHLVVYSGKVGSTWVLFGGRATFSEKTVEREVLKVHAEFDTFFAFTLSFPIDAAGQVLEDIVRTESIGVRLGESQWREIKFCVEGDPTPSWSSPYKFDRAGGKQFYGIERPGLSWTIRVDRQLGTRPGMREFLDTVSEQLRGNTHIDGTEALARRLTPGFTLNSLTCPEFQVIALMPFDLADARTGAVKLALPATVDPASVSLNAFFYPEPQVSQIRWITDRHDASQDAPLQIYWQPDWPEAAIHANIHLFWGRRNIDGVSINRWPASASIRGALDEYFDTNHDRLREDLKYKDRKSSDSFELAVVRLLNILGIPTVWYGKTAQDRADAVGILRGTKSTLLVLIECTRERPAQKFSTVAERARHLRESLGTKTEVLPVVFTSAHVVMSETQAAAEYGVGLIGSAEIEQLLKLIAMPDVTTDKVLRHFSPQQSIADLILGIAGQLGTPE